jgi:hypothetical protein
LLGEIKFPGTSFGLSRKLAGRPRFWQSQYFAMTVIEFIIFLPSAAKVV